MRGLKATQYFGSIGDAVASAGDVNGDGKDEIMVSNYVSAITPKTVWVCKYTGPGVEERTTPDAKCLTLEINPNPSRTLSTIRFALNADSKVSLKVYDITGKVVKVFNAGDNINKPGDYVIKWDLKDDSQKRVSSGIYFLKIAIDNGQETISKINKIIIAR